MRRLTPLRYPGGKAQLADFFVTFVELNELGDGVYVEPFAGGAGVAIALLLNEYVGEVMINDIDPAVYAFWVSATEHTEDFCRRIASVPLTICEWERQRDMHRAADATDVLQLGFSMFYLNRTNRSGILNGGVIGGKAQTGGWKIDARFNRDELIDRVRRIGRYRSRITVSNKDAAVFLTNLQSSLPAKSLAYLDPPYYEKGQHLYTNYYRDHDHKQIAKLVAQLKQPWIVSYDNCPEIRAMYKGFRRTEYELGYSARDRRRGAEVMFFSDHVRVPAKLSPYA